MSTHGHSPERTRSTTSQPNHGNVVPQSATISISLKGKERMVSPDTPLFSSLPPAVADVQTEPKQKRRVSALIGPRAPGSAAAQKAPMTTTQPLKSRIPLRTLFEHPRVFRGLLKHTSWEDFHSFASTCRTFRLFISHPDYRDVILSQFVPGYGLAMTSRDLQQYRDVQIDMHDLTLLRMSLATLG